MSYFIFPFPMLGLLFPLNKCAMLGLKTWHGSLIHILNTRSQYGIATLQVSTPTCGQWLQYCNGTYLPVQFHKCLYMSKITNCMWKAFQVSQRLNCPMPLDALLYKVIIFKVKNNHQFYNDNQWKRQWHPTLILLPGKSHGQRSLVGCSSWGC